MGQTIFLFRQKESLAKKIPQVCGTRLGCSTTRLSVASPEKKLASLKQFFSGFFTVLLISGFQEYP
jgi:hypothetical protein